MNLQDPNLPSKLAHNPNHKQWTTGITNDGRVYIQDDNFEYDARLYINGDFYDQELELNYANAIAEALIALWDGKSRGTKNMIETATKNNLLVYVKRTDL